MTRNLFIRFLPGFLPRRAADVPWTHILHGTSFALFG
jgi:hypothetical protein